ncbi:MAG: flagellar biosynthetic protein FlhB [Phycisphaerae bacterium]|nr:MAG: flagellar biosynthetic protein FlhB [Phycisphaerae bacterium]
MADDLGERTELPTPRRLEEAREKGQVPKSQDLASAVDLLGALIVLVLLGAFVAGSMVAMMRAVLDPASPLPTLDTLADLTREVAVRGGVAAAPILAAVVFLGVLSHFIQVGPLLTGDPLRPKWNRLSPIAGVKRILGPRGLVRTGLNSVKMIVVFVVSGLVLAGVVGELAALPRLTPLASLAVVGGHALRLALALLALLLGVGVLDYVFQRWQHTRDLRMTKEQVKDERRSMEGDPKVKAARQRMARQIALQRISQAVPQADVVVTNPTHFSVAIRYDAATMDAPRVVAKGADYLAMRIRQVAAANRVPMVERPPLARALFAGCEVGQEVPPEMYQAVAEVLAYVYRLEHEVAA